MPTRALFETIFAEAQPAVRMLKRARLLTVEERRERNTARKQAYRERMRRCRERLQPVPAVPVLPAR
jgi:hypothetical protein